MNLKLSRLMKRFVMFPRAAAVMILLMALFGSQTADASVTATVSGVVRDASGAVLPGVEVVATNTATGVRTRVTTDAVGFYSLQALPVGTYDLVVKEQGFKSYQQSGLLLKVNDAITVDVALQVGQIEDKVVVEADAVHAETSSTQMGEVIESQKILAVPLVTRSYTDLLALQAGVSPTTSGLSGGLGGQFTSTGFAMQPVSGSLNPGNLSVNGMRESSNGFLLNGVTVQETGFSGTSAIPNLDSIEEFRIITNNFDAEYGNYAGGQINVITKSGMNSFHGSAFEFLRNTVFDARGYFDPSRPVFQQNEFGGTGGGPIKHNKLFFFADYQGTRRNTGQSTGLVTVPSNAQRSGDFLAVAPLLTGSVQGTSWAQQLSQSLGYAVSPGERYYTAGCVTSAQCVFPNAQIPTSVITTPSKNLLQYIPPVTGMKSPTEPIYASSSVIQRLQDDKGSARLDANTNFGLLSAYYFRDDDYLLTPSAVSPIFGSVSRGRVQVINLSDTKTISSSAVNEARIGFTRLSEVVNAPTGGIGPGILAQLGFTNIVPSVPAFAGVPLIGFQQFTIGSGSTPLPIIENSFTFLDSYSKIVGTHTLKFGGQFRYNQLTLKNLGSNGSFSFDGSETGLDFADFLIGAPQSYSQGQGFPSYGRQHGFGLYAQDSWRVRSDLTVNYGLRYEVSSPWSELHNEIQTIIPGLQSLVFPGSPRGWVFPGDPGVPSTLAPTKYNNFAPRLGLAYSPGAHGGWLDKLTGGPGNTSIRAAWGKFYTTFEGATNFNEIGDAPFGFFYGSPVPPQFANPYINRGTGVDNGQRFPVAPPPFNASPSKPNNSIDWSVFLPISSSPAFWYRNTLPYAVEYDLAIDRQLTKDTLFTIAYVGSQGHHLLSSQQANPGNPALCLSVSQTSQVAPGSPTCGPFRESQAYTTASGTVINGTRPLGLNFGSNAYFKTFGNSDYNSLQLTLKRNTRTLEFLLGYTFSKSKDTASGYGEQVHPINPNIKALSAFDVTHNFVASYSYRLPFDKIVANRLTSGWSVSGITRFSTGLPVTLLETDDNSLLGTAGSGPIQLPTDTPNFAGGSLAFTNPRSGKPYFNTSLFSVPASKGQLGNASRRFFHGPGINNWDISIQKDTHLTERFNLQFRSEFFNAFNHAQFGMPHGNINDATSFGFVSTANPPRIMQLSLKALF